MLAAKGLERVRRGEKSILVPCLFLIDTSFPGKGSSRSVMSTTPTLLTDLFAPQDWLTLLEVSLTGIHLVRPLYAPGSPIINDFAIEYLNPAGQRMTGLSEQPGGTLLGRFPHALAEGIFQYYRRVFETGEPLTYETNYQADGLDNYFKFSAKRSGAHLLVSFTDTSDQDRTAVEQTLRQSQVAEQAARAQAERQRQRLHDILLALPAHVAITHGPTHVFELVNGRYQQLFAGRQLLGQPIRQALAELVSQPFYEHLDRVYQTGEPFYGHELLAPVYFADSGQSETRYYDVFFQPLHDAQGRLEGVLNFAFDVTEQVQSRQQVEQLNQELETRVLERTQQVQALQTKAERAHAYLERVFRQAPIMVNTQLGPEHVFDLVHPLTYQLLGHRPLVGLASRVALPELEGPFHELLDRVYQTGQPFHGTAVPARLDRVGNGELDDAYFDFTYQPLYDTAGQVEGVITFAIEVTEQIQARQQREAQEAQLQAVFEQAPVAIFVLHGPEFLMTIVNPAMQQQLGRPLAELLGKPYLEALPELADQGYATLLDQIWRTGQPFVAQEQPGRLRHHQGETRYFTFTSQPLRDAQGRVTDIMCVSLDVTDQVLARQQVQRLNEQLAAINEKLTVTNEELHTANTQLTRTNVDLDTFVYTASHDLKAPITNIEGILLALRQHLAPEVQQDKVVGHLLQLLQHTVERFRLTISQLTDISQLQLAHTSPTEPVPLAAVVEAVRLDLVPDKEAAATQLRVNIAPDLVVSFSPANLRSIVYNLLSNAVKYRDSARPSVVTVAATRTGQAVVLTVQDNGLGLTEAQQQRLFGLFQRLHTHVEGTGVGLYILKRMVENAGGAVAVQSAVGVGSTFTVTFPS